MRWILASLLLASTVIAADLSITPANVRFIYGRITNADINGNTATAGDLLVLQAGAWQINLDESDKDSDALEDMGIALSSNSASERQVPIQLDGQCDIGAVTVKGAVYVGNDDVEGAIMPYTDHPAGDTSTVVVVGIGVDTSGTIDLILQQVDVTVTSAAFD